MCRKIKFQSRHYNRSIAVWRLWLWRYSSIDYHCSLFMSFLFKACRFLFEITLARKLGNVN